MEEKSEIRNLKHKSYLLLLKYLPHLIALLLVVYTLLQFANVDAIIIGYIINYILVGYVYICSLIFKFCYVHRLPIYYYIVNELTSVIDNYVIQIPVDIENEEQLAYLNGDLNMRSYNIVKKLERKVGSE